MQEIQDIQAIQEVFDNKSLTVITIDGKPWFICREIGRVLGYSKNGSRFTKKVTHDWPEMKEGLDYRTVEGQELNAFKCLLPQGPESGPCQPAIGDKARRLTILSETGLYKGTLLSKKPKGIELRCWAAEDVFPAIRRGELVPANTLPVQAPAVPQLAAPLTEEQKLARRIANSRSRRENKKLALKKEELALEEKELAHKQKMEEEELRVRKLKAELATLEGFRGNKRVDAVSLDDKILATASQLTGTDLSSVLIKPSGWLTPKEMAARWKTTAQDIGTLITAVGGLRNNPTMSHSYIGPGTHGVKEVTMYTYSIPAQTLIYNALQARRAAKSKAKSSATPPPTPTQTGLPRVSSLGEPPTSPPMNPPTTTAPPLDDSRVVIPTTRNPDAVGTGTPTSTHFRRGHQRKWFYQGNYPLTDEARGKLLVARYSIYSQPFPAVARDHFSSRMIPIEPDSVWIAVRISPVRSTVVNVGRGK